MTAKTTSRLTDTHKQSILSKLIADGYLCAGDELLDPRGDAIVLNDDGSSSFSLLIGEQVDQLVSGRFCADGSIGGIQVKEIPERLSADGVRVMEKVVFEVEESLPSKITKMSQVIRHYDDLGHLPFRFSAYMVLSIGEIDATWKKAGLTSGNVVIHDDEQVDGFDPEKQIEVITPAPGMTPSQTANAVFTSLEGTTLSVGHFFDLLFQEKGFVVGKATVDFARFFLDYTSAHTHALKKAGIEMDVEFKPLPKLSAASFKRA